MAWKNVVERAGGKIVASYLEAVDETTGMVVRALWFRMDYGAYRTPFDGAHLDIGVEKYGMEADAQGVVPRVYIIQHLRMAKTAASDPCETWPVPEEKMRSAGQLAVKAIDLYASNLDRSVPVKIDISLAPRLMR